MNNLKKFMRLINYEFKDTNLLEISLTHSSYNRVSKSKNYERLEFLGDRVLGLIISNEIFNILKNASEGDLAKRYSYLVCKKTLNEVADSINLSSHIKYSKDISKKSLESIKANSLEALIAAIFLDSNLKKTSKVILKLWSNHIKSFDLQFFDPKSKLQEWCLKKKKGLPIYNVLRKEGPDHKPIFDIEILIENKSLAVARGRSKQEAEINAAHKLLKEICD